MDHHPNYFELIVLSPKEGDSFTDPAIQKDLQYVLDVASSYQCINFQFRKSVTNPEELLFIASWAAIEDYDNLDIQGVTPKLLKILFSRVVPKTRYWLYMDASLVDFDSEVWRIDAFHVKGGEIGKVKKGIEERELAGGWYATKKIAPLPIVMPTDPEELMMIVEGRKGQEARLKEPNPNIWVGFSTPRSEDNAIAFGESVLGIVEKVESGKYEQFLRA